MRLPFSAVFAMELAKLRPSPDAHVIEIDRMLMFLGRYANQDAVKIQNEISMRDLKSWADRTAELLAEENRNSKPT